MTRSATVGLDVLASIEQLTANLRSRKKVATDHPIDEHGFRRDWREEDLERFLCRPRRITLTGMSLAGLFQLGFPPHDYMEGGEKMWKKETVEAWRQARSAMVVAWCEAEDPGSLKRLEKDIRALWNPLRKPD